MVRELFLAVATKPSELWDADNGALLHTLTGHIGSVLSVAISPDGLRIVSVVATIPSKYGMLSMAL